MYENSRVFWPRDTKPDIAHRPGVCHSSPFVGQSPPLGRPFRQNHQPGFEVDAFDEMVAPMGGGEIVQQMGRSGIRLGQSPFRTFRQNR